MSLVTYRSSAGSGKTSTLVIEYLAIALQKPGQFKQIVALTFTQKATAEMKERLVEYLISIKEMDAKKPDGSILYIIEAIRDKTRYNFHEIKSRAKVLLTNILHNYGDFGFSTIDSFVVKIVRSFAHDLKLSANFEIELDSSIIIEEAIGQLNELIGKNEEITNFMIAFTLDQLDNEKSPDLDEPLANLGKLIFDSKHYNNIDLLKDIPLQNFLEIRTLLLNKTREYEAKIESFGKKGHECISNKGLSKGDCSSSWLWSYFNKLKNRKETENIAKLETASFLKFVENGNDWYAKSKPISLKESIDSAKGELLDIILEARKFYMEGIPIYLANKLILQRITPLALIHQMKQIIEMNYEENDMIHLSEANRKISEVVNEQHAPYIYERIGQRFNHFLIDEFQDTSVIQWNNMLPLIDNSLASNFRNLLVGDTKQSIYRWRDGEVEQFASLPNIIGENKSVITKERETLLKAMYEEVILDTNYRSKENIVNFNNKLFSFILNNEDDYVKSFFQNHIQKTHKKFNSGVVKLTNVAKNKNEEYKNEDLINSIIYSIKDLTVNQNYEFGDICILARKNKFLSQLAYKLIDNNIKVYSSEALFLISSNTVNVIINFMNIIIDNNFAINSYSALRYFYKQNNKGEPGENINSKSDFINKINSIGYTFDLELMDNMDAYELCEYVVSNLKLENSSNPFIYSLLDVIIELSKKKGASISQFIDYWEDNKGKLKIDLAGDKDSVQLLTIHRAKGLEFPVVIFPIIEIDSILNGRDILWVEPDEEIKEKVPKVLIGDYKYGLNSQFADIISQEMHRKELDAMNMIYVACTRPTQELHLFFNKEKDSQKYWNACNSINWEDERVFVKEDNMVQIGEDKENTKHIDKNENSVSINSFISNFWKDKIHLQRDISKNKALRDKGTQLHYLLSITDSETNIEDLISTNLKKGMIYEEYALEFETIIKGLLANSETKYLFSTENEYINEKEIITPDNRIIKPDRILLNKNEIIVIDYKYASFGTISSKDMNKYKKQLENYQEVLSKIYGKHVQALILFLSPIKIVDVVS